MAQPRRLSRPDRPIGDSRRRDRFPRDVAHPRALSGIARRDDDGCWIDPGRLIETAFRARCPAEEPETYVLAWLALLRPASDAPRAAAMLSERLSGLRPRTRSPWQRRLIALFAFVASHRRRPPAATLRSVKPPPKKGMP